MKQISFKPFITELLINMGIFLVLTLMFTIMMVYPNLQNFGFIWNGIIEVFPSFTAWIIYTVLFYRLFFRNLSEQKNSKLAAIIKNNLRMNLWNQGGQGIGNNNYNDAYGKVTVHGDSTVTLAAIDKYGTTICSYEVKNGFVPKHYKLKPRKRILKIRALKNLLKIALHL